MSWNNCKKCVFTHPVCITSNLFKVLVTLKLLHGARTGAKGSTLEDIAMYMIKYFSLDGDIKSQVLATLKFGVKMHFIQKRKDKFGLIMPAASIHLAPCKFKNEEIERIQCLFPPKWQSNACGETCTASQESCCGRHKKRRQTPCGSLHIPQNVSAIANNHQTSCINCGAFNPKPQQSKSVCNRPSCSQVSISRSSCDLCFPPPKRARRCISRQPPPVCGRRRKQKSAYDDYSQMCGHDEEDENIYPESVRNCSCCQGK